MLVKRFSFELLNKGYLTATRFMATGSCGRRVVFHGPSSPQVVESVALPEIENGEILGKVKAATICGSDLHTILGRRTEPTPSILGHEGVVEVIDHKGCDHVAIGDRLTFTVADFCRHCERCEDGLEQKCFSLFKYGHALTVNGSGWNGCYATHIVIRRGTHVVKLPDNIPDDIGATLNCSLASMTNAVEPLMNLDNLEEMKEENKEKSVLVQGAGLLGMYTCALFREAGFRHIYCLDVHKERLKMAERFGAVPLHGDKNEEKALKNDSIDIVMEVGGVKKVVEDGIRVVKPGGSYTFVGLVHPDSKLDITAEQIIRKCLTIRGIHNYRPIHLEQAVRFLSQTMDKYPYEDLVSEPFDLDNIEEAVKVALTKKYQRVCVKPREHLV